MLSLPKPISLASATSTELDTDRQGGREGGCHELGLTRNEPSGRRGGKSLLDKML